jgi:glutathionylspermidine synthase
MDLKVKDYQIEELANEFSDFSQEDLDNIEAHFNFREVEEVLFSARRYYVDGSGEKIPFVFRKFPNHFVLIGYDDRGLIIEYEMKRK